MRAREKSDSYPSYYMACARWGDSKSLIALYQILSLVPDTLPLHLPLPGPRWCKIGVGQKGSWPIPHYERTRHKEKKPVWCDKNAFAMRKHIKNTIKTLLKKKKKPQKEPRGLFQSRTCTSVSKQRSSDTAGSAAACSRMIFFTQQGKYKSLQ